MVILRRYRHINRYRQIANTLVKHGFGHIAALLGLNDIISVKNHKDTQYHNYSSAERLVMVLEDLGPTFVKFGQILSTRVDIIPKAYIDELVRLQDDVPPMSGKEAKKVVEEQLEKEVAAVFKDFDWNPIASASIGQVHRARLLNDTEVAVKIQRNNIRSAMEIDLEILFELVSFLSKNTSWAKQLGIIDVVEELASSLKGELDYTLEGRNGDRFRSNFMTEQDVYFPQVIWEYTTSQVLIMEYVESIKISNIKELLKNNWNLKLIAERYVMSMMKQIFLHGFFHADPHPGNVGVQEEKIIFMDYGQVGKIDEWAQGKYIELIIYFIKQDVRGIVNVLWEFGAVKDEINRKKLEKDILKLKEKYYKVSINHIQLGEALREIMSIIQEHQIKLPAEFGLIVKALLMVEGVALQLDPELSVVEIAEPLGKELLVDRFKWQKLRGRLSDYLAENIRTSLRIPQKLYNILCKIEEGQGSLKVNIGSMDKFVLMINIASNRISLSIVLASIIIGSALNIHGRTGALLHIPMVELGFIIAVILGIWLVVYILRGGKY